MYDRFMKYLVFITKEFDNFETQKWKIYRAIYFEKSNLIWLNRNSLSWTSDQYHDGSCIY